MTNIDVFVPLRPHLQGAGFESPKAEEHSSMMFLINSEGHILMSTVSEMRDTDKQLPAFANIVLSFPWGKIKGACKERQTNPEVALKLAILDILSKKKLPKSLTLSFESFLAKDVLRFSTQKVA